MGIAFLAAPGVAAAEGGAAGPRHADSSPTSHTAKGTNAPHTAPLSRRVKPSPVRQSISAAKSGSRGNRAEPQPVSAKRSTAAVPVLPTVAPVSAQSVAGGGGLSQFLTNTANWLSGLRPNPITELLQGAVWLVRRTLFPSTVGVITAPITVPLQVEQVCFSGTDSAGNCNGPTVQRLGIYVSLGTGNPTPQLFEFDTGGAGFLAAYASADPSASPWWGSGVTTGSAVTKQFDSGTHYDGVAASTVVSFFTSATSTTPLLTSDQVSVGRMDEITVDDTKVWKPDGEVDDTPPVDGVFYGDFGVAPSYEADGISSLLNELTFANGVKRGFGVSIDPDGQAWLQIGLAKSDLQEPMAMAFPMLLDPSAPGNVTAPHSGTRYYAQQLFQATINIVDSSGATLISDAGVGITPDTGADTTLHNTNRSSQSSAITYAGITIPDGNSERLNSGLSFSLSGTTTSGSPVTYYGFDTGSVHDPETGTQQVNVQNTNSDKDVYYLNTGISLFDDYDVLYDMGNARGGGELVLTQKESQGANRVGTVTNSAAAVGSTLGGFISDLFANGTAAHPDAGLLAGNGFSFDTRSCPGTTSCTGGQAGWLVGSGGSGFNGGSGGRAGLFGGTAGAGGDAATDCTTDCGGGAGGAAGLVGTGAAGGKGHDGGAGGAGGRGGVFWGDGGTGGRGGEAKETGATGGTGGRGGNASPTALWGNGGVGGEGGEGKEGEKASDGDVGIDGGNGGAGGTGGEGGAGGSGSWIFGMGGMGGTGGRGGDGANGRDGGSGGDGAKAKVAGDVGGDGGNGGDAGAGGNGGAGGDAGSSRFLLLFTLVGAGGDGGSGGGGTAGAAGNGGRGGDGDAVTVGGAGGGTGGDPGNAGGGGLGGQPGHDDCGCAHAGAGGSSGIWLTSGGDGGAGGDGFAATAVGGSGGDGGAGGNGGAVGAGGTGGEGGGGAAGNSTTLDGDGGAGGAGGAGGQSLGAGGDGGSGGTAGDGSTAEETAGARGGAGGAGGDALSQFSDGSAGGNGGDALGLHGHGGHGGDGGDGDGLGTGGQGGDGGTGGAGGTNGIPGTAGTP